MANQQSRLHVEGKDDYHALSHLLASRQLNTMAPWFPEVKETGGVDGLLNSVDIAVRFGTGHAVGFVLDANTSPNDRWRAVSSRLARVGLTPPENLPVEGYIDFCESFQTRTGVWLMPDNRREGALEDFLIDLITPTDPLLSHARSATNQAQELGASFPTHATRKAELQTWLAWCEEPGLPYGSALRAGYFVHDSTDSEAFLTWFRKLFQAADEEAVSDGV